MFLVKADTDAKRIYIIANQALSPSEFQELIQSVHVESKKLQPGWAAAVDLRGMWIDNPFINEQFQSLQEALLNTQAGKIATLLDSDTVKMHLWQSGMRTQSNKITRRFFDEAEWERFLSQK